MMLRMKFRGMLRMIFGVEMMGMRGVCMVGSRFMVAGFIVFCRFVMMFCGFLAMRGGLLVVFCVFF
ncbi:hypothetical protein [Dinghuibacter silviterrae]|uniref:hypothetical protein n=1 Tax=Dinghuibacter silviterrae TaxID=1539049 RepID=UPI0013C363D0|nr:hypothetical protein [Dinghuibacter silviterrae]